MAQTRKAARDALYAALADASTGFNAQFAALNGEAYYSLFLDFSAESKNVAQAFVGAENWDALGLTSPALAIYTTSAANLNSRVMVARSFSGTVTARADFHLQVREMHDEQLAGWTVDRRKIEDLLDTVEEAAVKAVDAASWQNGIEYAGMYRSDRVPPTLYGDGYYAVVPIEFTFEVFAD